MTIKKTSRFYNFFRRDPILRIFTEEYKNETLYYENLRKNINRIKLKCGTYDIDEKVRVLREEGYQSNFHISIPFGSYDNDEQVLESSIHGQKKIGTK